jgi:hypothetical protein
MVLPLIAAGAGNALRNMLRQNQTYEVDKGFAEEARYGVGINSLSKIHLESCAEKSYLDAPGGPAREARARHFQDLLNNRSDFSKIFDWRGDYQKAAGSVKVDVDSRIKKLALDGKSSKALEMFSDKLDYAISIGESQNSGRMQPQVQKDNVAQSPRKPMYADETITKLYELSRELSDPEQQKATAAFANSVQNYSAVKRGNGINFAAQGLSLENIELDKVILAELRSLNAAGRGKTSEAMALNELLETFRIFKSKQIAVV